MAEAVEIEGDDVVRLLLQFLAESGLSETARALRTESSVTLCALSGPQRARLASDVANGRWDAALEAVAPLGLAPAQLADLYEQAALELAEAGERETARSLLRLTPPLAQLRNSDPQRHARIERATAAAVAASATTAAMDPTLRERRRAEVARGLLAAIPEARPSRLLELLGEAVRWERAEGRLPAQEPSTRVDVFRGCVVPVDGGPDAAATANEDPREDRLPTRVAKTVRLGEGSHFECAVFGGKWLATGSTDGFAELWDPSTGALDTTTLQYQGRDELLLHGDSAVLSVAFSMDGEKLATGGADGCVKVWAVRSGRCLKKIETAHEGGVSCAVFDSSASLLYTGSFDSTARAHGLRSGRTLRVFRGHTGFVNSVALARGDSTLVTASADGAVKLWDARTADCLSTIEVTPLLGFVLPQRQALRAPLQLLSAVPLPHDPETLLVCTKGSVACLVSLSRTAVVRTFSASAEGDLRGSSCTFVCCMLSHTGRWVLCAAEDGTLHCFDFLSSKLEHSVRIGSAPSDAKPAAAHLLGAAAHPSRNILASWAFDGTLKFWL